MKRFSDEAVKVEFALNGISSAYDIIKYDDDPDIFKGDTPEERQESLRKYIEKFWNDISEEQVLEYLDGRHYVNDKVGGPVVGKKQAKSYIKALRHFKLMSIPWALQRKINR